MEAAIEQRGSEVSERVTMTPDEGGEQIEQGGCERHVGPASSELGSIEIGRNVSELFMNQVESEVEHLELLSSQGRLQRIDTPVMGAELELWGINRKTLRPASVFQELPQSLKKSGFVNELGAYNIENNLPARELQGGALSDLESDILSRVGQLEEEISAGGAEPLLSSMLPTLEPSDVSLDNITPKDRYFVMLRGLASVNGGKFGGALNGPEGRIELKCDSHMLVSTTTSFQLHLQVDPEEFVDTYNIVQAISGIQLASSVSSPLVFGKFAWDESRIPVFEQGSALGRTPFGKEWLSNTTDLLRQNLEFPPVYPDLSTIRTEESKEAPDLKALRLHNSTVWRINRAVYDVFKGEPSIRIESRYLGTAPTAADNAANAAFFYGLVKGLKESVGDIRQHMDFRDARSNFYRAAKGGLQSRLNWMGETLPAATLIERLIPVAKQGLEQLGIDQRDVNRYISIVERRVAGGNTFSQFAQRWVRAQEPLVGREEALRGLVAYSLKNQRSNTPLADWVVEGVE